MRNPKSRGKAPVNTKNDELAHLKAQLSILLLPTSPFSLFMQDRTWKLFGESLNHIYSSEIFNKVHDKMFRNVEYESDKG